MDEVFDVQAALKDHPESEVAAHVAQLHGIDRDAYLKGGQTDAEFLSEFGSKTLPSATPTSVNLSPDALASRNDPLNSAGTGAILGGTASAGKIAFDRVFPGQPTTAAPELIPDYVPDPNGGQRYKAKTGYGAGEGETSKEVSDEWKRIQAEKTKGIGRGKISSRVTGGSPDEILARAKQEEAELADQARIRAEIRLKEEAQHKAAQAAALEKKIAYEAEKKFHIPNAVGKMLPVAGATAGYNIQDVINQDNPVQKGIAAVGAAGSATPFIKKLPPKLRAIGVGASLLAPVINRGIDAIQDHAAGGSIQHLAVGGLDKLAKKGLKFAGKALKPLERAPAKTRAEIQAIAERMAPQELGQFVRSPGKTTSVAGLSKDRYDREQGLVHDIRNEVSTKSLPEMDYHKRIGDVSMMLPGDKSIVADIHSFAGIPLEKKVRAEGGVPYPIDQAAKQLPPEEPPRLWTSTGKVAKNYVNLGKKVANEYDAENVLPIYANMPQGMGYSQHFADLMLQGLNPSGADLGKATDMMRTGSFKGKSFPDFPGFEDMSKVYELFKHDPEMRQLFTNRLQIQDVAKSLGLPPTYGTDALHAISVPELRNLETGAGGHMVGKLDLHSPMTLSEHNGYIPDRDTGLHIPGEAIARNKYATPYDMQWPDLLNDIRNNPITYESKTGKPMIVPEFGRLKMDSPRQIIDPQHADEMAMYNEEMKKLIGRSEGGSIQHFGIGGVALAEAKAALKMAKPAVNRIEMNFKDVTKRIPQLQEAAKKLQSGEITREEYEHLVNTHKPVTPYSFIPSPAKENEARDAVGKKVTKNGLDLWQHPIPEGHQVGLRLDIPAYTNKGVWVNSIHNEGEKGIVPNTSYSNVSSVKNAMFGMPQDEMLGIAAGASKSPKAKITGSWNPVDEQSAVTNAQEYLSHPDWRQVGMDPERHGYFYDRETMEPITHAEEALQIGPLVLAKKPVYGNKEDFKYADGGEVGYAPGGKVGALEMLAKKLMPLAEREANKAKFLDPSAIKNVMYHGTATDISQFRPKQVGATFLTDSPNFAGGFADSSEHYLKQQLQNSLSSAELAKLNDQSHKLSRKTGESATDLYHQMLKERLPTGQNVMPVHVQATNPFDYDDPEHIANLRQYLQNNNSSRADAIADAIHGKGSWDVIEMPETQNAIKKMGHDSFYAQEGGNKNLGIYDPNKIKSAIGNEGTYDITNPDITKKEGGPIESIEKQLKKIRKHLKKHK